MCATYITMHLKLPIFLALTAEEQFSSLYTLFTNLTSSDDLFQLLQITVGHRTMSDQNSILFAGQISCLAPYNVRANKSGCPIRKMKTSSAKHFSS